MNKFKLFWIKVGHVLRRFPVFMSIAVILPVTIYYGRFLFAPEAYYFNLNFDGEKMPVDPTQFSITKIDPMFKIMDISSFSNYQGAAGYKNYYALCSNNFECIIIYNMETKKVENQLFTDQVNNEYHCNTCFFGPYFYKSSDKYPLLYISMENEGIESTIVCRLDPTVSKNQVTVIQQIYFEVDDGEKIYYPNSYFDYDNGLMYYGGYTKKSYMQSEDNLLRYYVFQLPDYRIEGAILQTSDALDTFDLPSETATQGGFISEGFLYQTFSFNSNTELKRMPKFRLVDLKEKKIIYKVDNLGEINGVYDEFENVAVCEDGHMYGFGVKSLKIYDFQYTGKK